MRIIPASDQLVEELLRVAGNSLRTFRYFNTRGISTIHKHLYTIIGILLGKPIAYGHLDSDGDKVWLGICVIEPHKGNGFGKIIMADLISFARLLKIEFIHLSVDDDNVQAIELYKQFGFVRVGPHHKEVSIYKLEV